MRLPIQSSPVTRRASALGRLDAGVNASGICATGSCTSSRCCASVAGYSVCIPNPTGISGRVQACYVFPASICFYIGGSKIGCVGV